MSKPVRKAVIPAAGLGTRFLPATKAVSKVMLPVLDTPTLHLVVAEAAAAGIDQVAVVVSAADQAIESYFQPNPELEAALRAAGKADVADAMQKIAQMATVETIIQDQPRGLGHAVSMAADWVGDESFAVLLPDDLILLPKPDQDEPDQQGRPTIGEMVSLHDRLGASVLAVKQVPDEAVPFLGIVDAEPEGDRLYRVNGMVEKPPLDVAPSNLAIIGRYVLTAGIFEALAHTEPGALGEVQITDAIAALILQQGVYAYRFPGDHFDAGVPAGMLEAAIHEALRRPDMSPRLKRYIAGLDTSQS
jgi:UTP--glucose-1-phosphate uridylyltransferase